MSAQSEAEVVVVEVGFAGLLLAAGVIVAGGVGVLVALVAVALVVVLV
jgi:hypothetical protein